ncbi:threonine ammonia-lyase [Cellulomonas shaoxiangyii]|uniref:threonine ammonia-lyase n=1 Tax=Cellulomonas shaoxiangyii TaxID=2566013 RepID=A0A4V1CMW7_9CELL|nr:threonine ammonia-lyase [Cellulomonas shaoxiangyii]QCB94385.1 threonine ammonia-lyase [Cellulomonas shaoxiangyii]TGY84755.1 threonine ammonia-lyase [Cellulomonas shaoxiangyii]
MIGARDVRAAAELLTGVAERTPVQRSRALSDVAGVDVWLKCENLQRAGSFKIRGAYVRMSRLSPAEKSRGVVAASAGNHAQGVALAARLLGLESVVFMPVDAALPKIAATRGYGAHVHLVGTSVDEALVHAREHAERTGAVLIHPFDHPDVDAGQGTVGLEVLEQVPDVGTLLVPVGGGGLAAGIAAALEDRPDVGVVGVQAARAASYPASLAAGRPVPAPELRTMADGIAIRTPGEVPFELLAHHRVPVRTVSEEDLSRALLLVAERAKLVVEPSGAAAVAALMADPGLARDGRPVVCVLSGGNIDPLVLLRVVRHGLASAGRYLQVHVRVEDAPGALAGLLHDVAAMGGNVVHVAHTRTGGDLAYSEVAIDLQIETKGPEHCGDLLAGLRAAGYRLGDA